MAPRDWAKTLLKEIRALMARLESDSNFQCRTELRRPLTRNQIQSLEDDVASQPNMKGFQLDGAVREFYGVSNGFKLMWQHLHPLREGLILTGSGKIATLTQLHDPEENIGRPFALYGEYRRLDELGTDYHVAMRFAREGDAPDLFYFDGEAGRYFHLSLGFREYLVWLVALRALFPWQEFFIDDPDFYFDGEARERFVQKLNFLFPEVDDSQLRKRAMAIAGRRLRGRAAAKRPGSGRKTRR